MKQKVRCTAVLIEDDAILLVKQKITDALSRQWSLPGGTLEPGETLEECVCREAREETGLEMAIEKLLYICDRIHDDQHTVHVTFLMRSTGGAMQLGIEPEEWANPITDIKMVPLFSLQEYGFDQRFEELATAGFPNAGCYMGPITNIGL